MYITLLENQFLYMYIYIFCLICLSSSGSTGFKKQFKLLEVVPSFLVRTKAGQKPVNQAMNNDANLLPCKSY